MVRPKSPTRPTRSKKLTIEDVKDLGALMIEASDLFPLALRTEQDFYPMVLAYLKGRVPGVAVEKRVAGGKIDFALGGTNPTALEIAVQPRRLGDLDNAKVRITGHTHANALSATINAPELRKLSLAKNYKTRFLLLLDLRCKPTYKTDVLKAAYERAGARRKTRPGIRVVLVTRSVSTSFHSPKMRKQRAAK